jgi:hypothetical protein
MKRNRNGLLWLGFALALMAGASYEAIFVEYPITRDFPWVNLLLFLAAGCCLGIGLHRAFTQTDRYRGKIAGPILSVLSVAIFGLFCFGVFVFARNIPPGSNALKVGQPAPDFKLTAADGKTITLSQLRQNKKGVLLIFYRGYW